MNLHALLEARRDRPVRIGIIGLGKFCSMFLAQARHTPGLHVTAVCDLELERARANLLRVGWSAPDMSAATFARARAEGTTHLTCDAHALIEDADVDVVVEATGDPAAGVRHALACFAAGVPVVMVNVEADALAGPLLARRAAEAGVVYSLAYGDQPALIVELVDWARACGFEVVCAGKGTKYLPAYHRSTPETVWEHYGLTAEEAARGALNANMFNSFLDGTKSAIEMAAVANATGLTPAPEGLCFPPCNTGELAERLKPRAEGGVLTHRGTVEVVSSLQRDGSAIEQDLRWGVFVTFEAASAYVAECFAQYGVSTDSSGRYASLFRPHHLIGLELGISIANVVLRAEPTGVPSGFRADAVATAKRELKRGETLDGEGGYTVWGRLMPAAAALAAGALPIGLAKTARLKRNLPAGAIVTWDDVETDESAPVTRFRREMERAFSPPASPAARTSGRTTPASPGDGARQP